MNEKQPGVVSKDVLTEELRFVLRDLHEKGKVGNRMRLGDARSMMQNSLTLDFAEYFKFLRRYNYLLINRGDQTLLVTDEGRAIVEKGVHDDFLKQLREHFGEQIQEPEDFIEKKMDAIVVKDENPLSPAYTATKVIGEALIVPPQPKPTKIIEDAIMPSKIGKIVSEPSLVSKGVKGDSKYTRYEAIGSGGIGTVYKGRHSTLALDVAIKEIKDIFNYFSFLQRSDVTRQLKSVLGQMATLNHPLIVKIIDENLEVAHPYFVMEFAAKGNLRSQLQKEHIDIGHNLILFLQICYALQAAHEQEVIHGDLKPENILLDFQGNVRVADFGMTRLLYSDAGRTGPQVITGTIGYLAPEQMKDRFVFSAAADIYSLGILLYEMLTGNLPGRRSPLPSEANREIPKAVDELFDKMTRDVPEDRYPSIDALLTDFYDSFVDGRYLSKGNLILFSEGKAPQTVPPPSGS